MAFTRVIVGRAGTLPLYCLLRFFLELIVYIVTKSVTECIGYKHEAAAGESKWYGMAV